MPEPDTAPDLVLRPITPRRTGGQWAAAGSWLVAAAAFSARFHGLALVVVWSIAIVLAVTFWLWLRSLGRKQQLALRGITLFDGTPRERPVFKVGQPGRVVQLTVNFGQRPREALCLVDAAGQSKVLLYAESWDRTQLDDLWHRLGVVVTRQDGVYSPRQFADEFPGLLSGWKTRPKLVGGVGAIVLIAVMSAVLLALGWHPER